MSHQQRNGRLVQQIVGHTTQQPLAQPEMAVSTHDDKVRLLSFSFCHQPGADLAAAAHDPMKDSVNSMMLEMVDGIDTEDRLFLGWTFAGHHHDRDLLRLVQIRHAFAQGSRRLPPAVPGDEDTIEGDLGPLGLGGQIEVAARPEQTPSISPLGIRSRRCGARPQSSRRRARFAAAILAISSASTSKR